MSERYPAPYAGGPPPGAYDPTGQDYYYGYGPIESPEASGAPAFNIRSLLGILRRNIWLILISTAIGLAGGVFVGSRAIPQYRASAAVQLVDPQRGVGSAL
ncbi:MAG TPA: Wzz/FepE/Etk N-terminal domain-containing protein, partial [Longimicrobiales bacterium]|nr:Wzz/FepE/Etk N-terminal domain-containing protein [Longimicrobiales bacterium]